MDATTLLPVDRIEVGHLRRPVAAAQVADLIDSIERLGLLQPVVVTTDRKLIAGRHRLEAVRRLDWATIPVVVVELSELEARLATLDENLVRNELSRLDRFEHLVQRAELVAALGWRKRAGRPRKTDTVSGYSQSTNDLAATSGLSGRTLQRAAKIVAAIPEDVRQQLKDSPLADSTTELLRLSRLPVADQQAVAARVFAGENGAVNDLFLAVKRARRKVDAARHRPLHNSDDQHVHVGELQKLGRHIPAGGATLFLCDPPYADLSIYADLGLLAATKLRPGGWLATYCSTHTLDRVMEALGASLRYYWMMAIRCTGVNKQMNGFHVRSGWKPLLIFQRPPKTLPPDWLNDFHVGGGREKDHHHWEQPVGEAAYLIERLTSPGDLVVDPTCGSGTALVAAKLAGRRWLGIDWDESAVAMARCRLAEAEANLNTPLV
jgi:ParB-like chromosome segregation protein Spo0J